MAVEGVLCEHYEHRDHQCPSGPERAAYLRMLEHYPECPVCRTTDDNGEGTGLCATGDRLCCIADGPDTWFAQTVLDHGGRIEVVLPAEQYGADLPDWHDAMYDDLLHQAVKTHRTGLGGFGSHAHIAGSELLVARVDELLAVWDGRPARS